MASFLLDQISIRLVMQHDYYSATFVRPSKSLYLDVLYAMKLCALRRSWGALRSRIMLIVLFVSAQFMIHLGRYFGDSRGSYCLQG